MCVYLGMKYGSTRGGYIPLVTFFFNFYKYLLYYAILLYFNKKNNTNNNNTYIFFKIDKISIHNF